MLKSILIILIILFFSSNLIAQVLQEDWLRNFSEEKSITWQTERAKAESLAKVFGLPIRLENPDGSVIELQRFENGMPMYFITQNKNAARTISTIKVWPGGTGGFSLTGSTDTLGIWDGGKVRDTHNELTGRVILSDGASTLSGHSTHVAGTMIASGAWDTAKGMSYQAKLKAYDWNNDLSEMATAAAAGLKVSNHSYGYIRGWYKTDGINWSWYGNPYISSQEDYQFGFYDSEAQSYDNIARNAPYYLIVKSAGNDRLEGPATQPITHSHSGSGSYNDIHNLDGEPDGYDCTSNAGVAKNILTVGAVDDILNGYSQPSDVVMSSFSCWGPTDDGRIKPDLVANGINLISAYSQTNSSYAIASGTSMSSPNVSGSLGLLLQYRKIIAGNNPMRSSTLKALVIHTADEAGSNPGPDYSYGWGLMNTLKAAQLMRQDSAQGLDKFIRELTLNQGQTIDIPVYSDGTQPLRATICWTDPAGTPVSPSLDPSDIMLVNDLDLRLIFGANTYYPWILNPSNPSAAATTGDNIRDNVEQVYIENPSAGFYLVRVSHKNTLSGGSQVVSLILSGIVPSVELSVQNVNQTAPNKLQFDVYLKNTGYLKFGYRSGQYAFTFNKNILNSGTGTMSIVSSDLPEAFRPVNPSVITSTTPGELRWEANAALDGGPELNPGDSIKIMTVELTNTVNYHVLTPDIEWKTTGSPSTALTRYILGNSGAGSSLSVTSYEVKGSNPLLPVQIAFFNGFIVNGKDVKLEWQTISEINCFGFYVEKFNELINDYVTIEESFQPGAGNSIEPKNYSWIDENIDKNNLKYRLQQVDNNGLKSYFGPIMLNPTGVEDNKSTIYSFKLYQNYPNPFNPVTIIKYELPERSFVKINVYDQLGREVAQLVNGYRNAGINSVEFDGTNLPGGVYYCKLVSDNYSAIQKLVLIK